MKNLVSNEKLDELINRLLSEMKHHDPYFLFEMDDKIKEDLRKEIFVWLNEIKN